MMPTPPAIQMPVYPDRDAEHLKLLAIFQFIFGGLMLLATGFLVFHYLIMQSVFSSIGEYSETSPTSGPPPGEVMQVMMWFYIVFGGFFFLSLVADVLCGLFLLKRKCRGFCIMAAVLQCLMVPLGTVLGIFTILVLCRPSVQAKFAGQP